MPWIDVSYAIGHPIMVGQVEVMRGTANLNDVLSWPGVPAGRFYGKLWEEASSLARRYHPTAFVGHSLGASYAAQLADDYHASYRGYGRPGLGVQRAGDVRNVGDPVSALLQGQSRWAIGHSTSAYQDPTDGPG